MQKLPDTTSTMYCGHSCKEYTKEEMAEMSKQ